MFYDRLLEAFKKNNVKITPLLVSLSISRGNIENWRNGAEPRAETLSKLAEALQVSTDYLLGKVDEKTPAPQEPSASLAYSPLEQEIIKAYRAAPPVLQEAVLNVLHIPIPASNVRQKKNA